MHPPETEPTISLSSETSIWLPIGLGELPHVDITVDTANLLFCSIKFFALLRMFKSSEL